MIFLALNILMLLGLMACQPGKETIVEKHYRGGGELPIPPSQEQGGIDGGGGGNGLNGKPLESFRFDIAALPSYESIRANVIDKLVIRFPELAADLLHVSEERAWYLIPVDLRKLPSNKIGTFFPTDQMAIQGLREIWINDLLFSEMKLQDQSMLVLHELLMGVKLLQFTNALDQCLVRASVLRFQTTEPNKHRDERRACFKKFKSVADVEDRLGLGKHASLNKDDYETIRDLTYKLMKNAETADIEDLKAWMEANNFRKYEKAN